MRKKFARVFVLLFLVIFLLPCFTGLAFAGEDEYVEFSSSDKDFKGYAGVEEVSSTWGLLRAVYGSEENVGTGTVTHRKGFFWSHGITVGAGMNYPLYSGLWGCHPAIFITVLPEAQLTNLPKKNGLNASRPYLGASGWNASDSMSMNYWLALAQSFRFGSDSYNFYADVKNGEIKAYITLKKAPAGSNAFKDVCKTTLLIASNQQHTNAMTEDFKSKTMTSRFYKTSGLYEDPLDGPGPGGDYYFYRDDIGTDTAAKPASNSVLFYDLETGAKYQVVIDVRVSYTDSAGRSYGQSLFRDESIVRTFSDVEREGKVTATLCGYAVGGNGGGSLMLKSLGSKDREVSLMEASRYVDSGLDISNDDPMAIMQDVSLFQVNPSSKDAEKLSSVFKLLRRLAITASIFGLGWAIFRVVLIDASGFMLMRLKMELQGWLGLIVIIGASVWVLSMLVTVLFGI